MGTPSPTSEEGRKLGFERFIFFSDAVFAIAITLLVLDLRVPDADAFAIWPLMPKLLGYGVSFYVIGRYWLAHHKLFEAVEGYDGLLLGANLWFLAGIAFLPFPTSVVTAARPAMAPVTFYAASLTVVGLAMVALVLIARRPALLRAGQTPGGTARAVAEAAAAPLVFAVTAAAAALGLREALWLLLLLFPVSWAAERIGQALQRRIDARRGGTRLTKAGG
jgi:uncharacterized membrane protein